MRLSQKYTVRKKERVGVGREVKGYPGKEIDPGVWLASASTGRGGLLAVRGRGGEGPSTSL